MKAKNEKTELSQGDLDQLYEEFRNGKSLTKLGYAIGIPRQTLTQLFIDHCGYVVEHRIPKHQPITDLIFGVRQKGIR